MLLKAEKHKKAIAVNRWSNGAFLRRGLKRGFMSMMKGVSKEEGRVESGQRRVWDGSTNWPKKRTLFPIQENQETVKEHSTLFGLIPNFARVIEMMCETFAPILVAVSVPKIGVVLIGPLLRCKGDDYGGALLAHGNSLLVVSFFSEDGLR